MEITEGAINLIAKLADGSMRDALSIYERCLTEAGDDDIITEALVRELLGVPTKEIVSRIAWAVENGDVPGIVKALDDYEATSSEGIPALLTALIEFYRDTLLEVCERR